MRFERLIDDGRLWNQGVFDLAGLINYNDEDN